MAAPLNMLSKHILGQFLRIIRVSPFVRGLKRDAKSILSPSEEVKQLRKKRLVQNPKKNPYIPFEPLDPVQQSLVEASKPNKRLGETGSKSKRTGSIGKRKQSGGSNVNKTEKDRYLNLKLAQEKRDYGYVRLIDSDKRFGQAVIRAKNKKEREKNREMVVEGRRLVRDALAADLWLKELYFSGENTFDDFFRGVTEGVPVYKVTYKHMKLWSDADQNNGIVAIFEMPPKNLQPRSDSLPITVIFDRIRSPGNLGSLIGTAEAVGCQKVITVKGCVDVWSPKVLKSALGSQFRIPVLSEVKWSDVDSHVPDDATVILVDSRNPTEQVLEDLAGSSDVVEDLNRLMDDVGEDSETDSDSEEDSDLESSESDSETESENQNDTEIDLDDKINEMDDKLINYAQAPLNVSNYDEADYVGKHTVLIVGGEMGSGLSVQARKLAYECYGSCVTIPMMPGAYFLNPSIAGSVVLFEASKQFRVKQQQVLNEAGSREDNDKVDKLDDSQT